MTMVQEVYFCPYSGYISNLFSSYRIGGLDDIYDLSIIKQYTGQKEVQNVRFLMKIALAVMLTSI